jgi:LPS sulfotransferase NodH
VLQYLQHDTSILVVHLWRNNLLERYVSEFLAVHVYGIFNVTTSSAVPPPPVVRLSADDCRASFERTERRRARFRAWLTKHQVLEVTYEGLVGESVETLSRIQTFLGVDCRQLETRTQKMRQRSLRQTVENYDELALAFRETPYARFFTE